MHQDLSETLTNFDKHAYSQQLSTGQFQHSK